MTQGLNRVLAAWYGGDGACYPRSAQTRVGEAAHDV